MNTGTCIVQYVQNKPKNIIGHLHTLCFGFMITILAIYIGLYPYIPFQFVNRAYPVIYYLCLIKGILTQFAEATATNGTNLPTSGGALCNTKNA